MHLPKNAFIVITLFLLSSVQAFAYKNKKAVLIASREMQKDSIGYNWVGDMAVSMQQWIEEGKVVLWDSPEKKHTLKSKDLADIESNTKTSFAHLQNIFIYEIWSANKRKFNFQVKGFSFASVNTKGEEVLYGYVDFNGALKNLMRNDTLNTFANASAASTLLNVLMNKKYEFALVYFNDGPVNDIQRSIKIQEHALGNSGKKFGNKMRVPDTRIIEYAIEMGNGNGWENSAKILEAVQTFLNQNPQEFYNYGGDKIISHLKKTKIILTELHIQESWSLEKGKVVQKQISVIPYIVGLPLMPIPAEQWSEWNFVINNYSLEEILAEKKFFYTITKINRTETKNAAQEKIKKALLNGEWSNLLPQNKDL